MLGPITASAGQQVVGAAGKAAATVTKAAKAKAGAGREA